VEAIDALYRTLASHGTCTDAEWKRLNTIAGDIVRRERLDAVVLAGTDLSPIFEERRSVIPVFDVAKAHIEEIIHHLAPLSP
jgi:aspartate/glutamate racemase